MHPLSRTEAAHRARIIGAEAMDVTVDLRHAADPGCRSYPVTTVFTLSTAAPELHVDLAGEVVGVRVDGQPHPWRHEDGRVYLENLPTHRQLSIDVEARCEFSRTGEGLHRYVDPEDGRTYLYTQFEPTDAHRAWPCLDQPDIKARWTFHVLAPLGWVVASNGALVTATEEVADEGGDTSHQRCDFATTRPLSSYLTALVAGEYAVVAGGVWSGGAVGEDGDGNWVDIPLRLMCRHSLAPFMDAEDILEVTRAGLDFFHSRYGVTYPWGTYDQVFVPEYNLGAMENPGCVTFNESYLSRDTPTFAERQKRANTILHEMCHMWFGDLVTPSWWDDLWLKESFAHHQGTMAAASATRYGGEWASFAVDRKAWAYQQDQLPTTHPIIADIPDVDAAKTNFDGITYAKGAAVLKQLVAWVGQEAFFAGARAYFREHAFSSTTMEDLLRALEASSGLDLAAWKRAWLDTCRPSVLRTTHEVGPLGQIRAFTLHQEAPGGAELVLRPHQLQVSTWAVRSGALVRTHRFEVRIDAETAQVDPVGILDVAGASADVDMVVVNDDDLTYAVTRLDEASVKVALVHVSTCDDAVTRAVVWAALWNAVRDGLLDPEDYIRAVLLHGPEESEQAVLERLARTVDTALISYSGTDRRRRLATDVVEAALMEARRGGVRHERTWLRMATRGLVHLDPDELAGSAVVQELAEGLFNGEKVATEVAWAARTALAAHGLVGEAELEQWKAADPSGETAVRHRTAVAALPDADLRGRLWTQVLGHDLSNDHLSATLTGLHISSADGAELVRAALQVARTYWEDHTIGMGIRFIDGALPRDPDCLDPALVDAWLDDNADAPWALRRLLIEVADDLKRAHMVRAAHARKDAQP